jgi:aspartate racemase
MKCLGLIGGFSWESTASYYRIINQEVRHRFGSLHSARVLVNSLEFQHVDTLVQDQRWNDAGQLLADAAATLERAGADGVLICSNLMHFVAGHIEAAISVPLLHVGDAIIGELKNTRRHRIGLLGTRFTLEHGFLLNRPALLKRRAASPIEIFTPDADGCAQLDRIIYGELCRGVVRAESRETLLQLIAALRKSGAQAIVLASSELSTLLRPDDFSLPLIDTTEIHALTAVRWALGELDAAPDFTRARLSATPGVGAMKRSKLVPRE